jgi:uncharacterized membrane protein YdjX (TVP38/TMEM64 family)
LSIGGKILKQFLLQELANYEQYAVIISILLNILIAIFAIIPSVFITAANVTFFGFWDGMWVSFIGEALGALVAFILYRQGFKSWTQKRVNSYPKLKKLINEEGLKAFYIILSLRIMPFIPSGIVTLASAVGKVSFIVFAFASSIGKLPALILEAYSIAEIINFNWQGKLILAILLLFGLYIVIKKK